MAVLPIPDLSYPFAYRLGALVAARLLELQVLALAKPVKSVCRSLSQDFVPSNYTVLVYKAEEPEEGYWAETSKNTATKLLVELTCAKSQLDPITLD